MARDRSVHRGEPPLTVWFDGDCPICSREIEWHKRQVRGAALTFVDIRRAPALPAPAGELLARFHARESGGAMLEGAAAFAALWRRSPWLRPLGLAARHPRVLAALDAAYGLFLRLRPRLQHFLRSAARPSRS